MNTKLEEKKPLTAVVSMLSILILSFAIPPKAWARTKSVQTVRGTLVYGCLPVNRTGDGVYTYRLSGKALSALKGECFPDHGISYVELEQALAFPFATTLLMFEGLTADAQTVRVIHIPKTGLAYHLDLVGGDGAALVALSSKRFRLTLPSGGFAVSEDRKSTWTCVYNIDFASGKVSGSLAVPHEVGLPYSVCDAKLQLLKLGGD
jgi:hypothetical protein